MGLLRSLFGPAFEILQKRPVGKEVTIDGRAQFHGDFGLCQLVPDGT